MNSNEIEHQHSQSDITVVVNSCDMYEDCWQPFFSLFEKYWPNCGHEVVLFTETKTYESLPGLVVRTVNTKGLDRAGKSSWGYNLINGLREITTKHVLYLQEDYFLNAPVIAGKIDEFSKLMSDNSLPLVRLMELGDQSRFAVSSYGDELLVVPQTTPYRINMQAAIWNRKFLLEQLREGETGWQFERLGSLRAAKQSHTFLCQNHKIFVRNHYDIIPYDPTGIVKGRWVQRIVEPLFKDHDIDVDFAVARVSRCQSTKATVYKIAVHFARLLCSTSRLLELESLKHHGSILGFSFYRHSLDTLVHQSLDSGKKPRTFACANPHSLVVATKNLRFGQTLHSVDFLVVDGVGLSVTGKLLGQNIGPRITGSDYFDAVMHHCNKLGSRVFFFGSTDTVLQRMCVKVAAQYPNVVIAGSLAPVFGKFTEDQNNSYVKAINGARPDVLWVGMTAPKQELWVNQNKGHLRVTLVGSVGAVFDFVAGSYSRAPELICKLGLEWLYRLAKEPKRMWKRNFVSAPRFVIEAVLHHLKSGTA